MDHRHLRAMCMAGVLIAAIGCDDDLPPGPDPIDTPVTEPATQPTEVPVTEQTRVKLPLKLIPFSLEAPESWQVVSRSAADTPITMVDAPIIGDRVNISLGLREAVGGEVLRNMIKRFEKEDIELKKNGGGVTITQKGDLRIIDIRRFPIATIEPAGKQRMEWQVTLLYPRGVMHEQYTMIFIGLTAELYEKNKSFLSEIIQSIKYDDAEISPLPKGF